MRRQKQLRSSICRHGAHEAGLSILLSYSWLTPTSINCVCRVNVEKVGQLAHASSWVGQACRIVHLS